MATVGYFVGTSFLRVGSVVQEIRTVKLDYSPSYATYLKDFSEYSISESDNKAEFSGVLPYNERLASAFDNVSLADGDTANYTTVVESAFNLEAMQFTFTMSMLDEEKSVIATDSIVTDAFVTENGGLDAYIEIDGESYLLSEYSAKLSDNVQECLFGWLIAAIVVIVVVVVYIVVAETAEQIKAKSNYTYNKGLESAGNGVTKNNYITAQNETSKAGYKSGNYRFGFTAFSGVGCEVASVYNLMIALSKAEMLSDTIYNFEKWWIEFSIGWGALGSDPKAIYRYLDKKGISYAKYTSYDSLKTAVNSKSACKIIMSQWNDGSNWYWPWNGIHTYYVEKTTVNQFYSYNYYYSANKISGGSIDNSRGTGGFIVGYVIG
jgi:hypothetical protein